MWTTGVLLVLTHCHITRAYYSPCGEYFLRRWSIVVLSYNCYNFQCGYTGDAVTQQSIMIFGVWTWDPTAGQTQVVLASSAIIAIWQGGPVGGPRCGQVIWVMNHEEHLWYIYDIVWQCICIYIYLCMYMYMYIYIYISSFICQLFCRSRTRGCGWTLALCQHSGAGQAASHRQVPWRWTGNQQLQDTRREGLVSRGRLLETPWISQFTQIGHGFYLFIYCSILGLLYYIPFKKNLCSIVCIDNGKHWPWQQLLQDGNEGQRTFKTAAGYENSKVPKGLGSHSHQVLGNICRRLLCFCFSPLTYG